MSPERWQQLTRLFDEAASLEPDQRAPWLDRACVGDAELRREVETLLKAHERAGGFLQHDAIEDEAARLATVNPILQPGQMVAHFAVQSLLGAGAMGEVYCAQDTRLERQVALKLLPARYLQDAGRLRRFEREARAVSALNHPNIITVFDIGQDRGRHFIAAEYVVGETLRERLLRGPLPFAEAAAIAKQIGAALVAAHAAGIVHRDIKPENVMLRADGLVKVLDFGIAKLLSKDEGEKRNDEKGERAKLHPSSLTPHPSTEQGMVIGTPGYMSPEQARGLAVDTRTDIFSLGVVLYEMLAGQPPFRGATHADVIVALLQSEPEPLRKIAPDVPAGLDVVLTRMLAKDAARRYQAVTECLAELEHHSSLPATAEAKQAGRPTLVWLLRTFKPTRGWSGIARMIGVALGLLLFVWFISRWGRQSPISNQQPTNQPTEAARAAYTRAHYLWNRRTNEAMVKAIAYYREALALEPNYAPAWAGLAQAYMLYGDLPLEEKIALVTQAANRALALDETQSEAHTALAFMYQNCQYEWDKAEASYRRAIELNPNDATARHWFAECLAFLGRFDEALPQIRRALEIDPLSLAINKDLGIILSFAGRRQEAIEQYKKTLELDPSFVPIYEMIASTLEVDRGYDEAVEYRIKAHTLSGMEATRLAALRGAYATAGWKGFWRQELRYLQMDQQRSNNHWMFAQIYVRIGERERAITSLQRAFQEHQLLSALKVDDILKPLHTDPRVQELLRQARLVR